MKVIVAGCRMFANKDFLYEQMDQMYTGLISEVVCGMARGVDSLGRSWAIDRKIPVKEFPANWERYGKRAGILRNQQMADYADRAIIFWDYASKGTENMIKEMRNRSKLAIIIPITIEQPVSIVDRFAI
jgi:hypothetical protein